MLKVISAIVLILFTSPAVRSAEPRTGEEILKASKCQMCHKMTAPEAGAEIDTTGPPNLRFVGDRRQQDWMVKFLKKEIDNNGMKHKVIFKGSSEDLAILTGWLASLKQPIAKGDSLAPVVTPAPSGK